MHKVLVVEDDPSQQELIRCVLKAHYVLQLESLGQKGLECALSLWPELVILDLGLPDIGSDEFLARLKADPRARVFPVLILSARERKEDIVCGLAAGADDYLVKPFHDAELLARISALLRRAAVYRNPASVIKLGPLTVDPARRLAQLKRRSLKLTPKEFALLEFMLRSQGRVFSRRELLEGVWGFDKETTTRTVDNHIACLRKKLGPPLSRFIQSFHKKGYGLIIPGRLG